MSKGKSLTAAFVKNIKEPGKYFDDRRWGLYLRIDKEGRKQWVQRVTVNGRRRESGLGSYPIVTLAMARDKALENKRLIYEGGDPIAEKRKHQFDDRFENIASLYMKTKGAELRSEKSRKQWTSTLETYAFPVIGHMYVQNIQVADILRVLQPIWHEKTETASRLRGRLERIMSWAIVSEYRKGDNPAAWKGVLSELLPSPAMIASPKHHAALQQADTARWWAELSRRNGMSIEALKFLALTGSRSGEVRGMVWEEVDFEAGNWTIPKERMKARRMHRVPLTSRTLELLKSLPRVEDCPYVFFSTRGGQLSDMALSKLMKNLNEADLKSGGQGYLDVNSGKPAVPHGLRSTFRDWAAETAQDHVLAELALAHDIDSHVVRAYRRTDALERRRKMMKEWEEFLTGNI